MHVSQLGDQVVGKGRRGSGRVVQDLCYLVVGEEGRGADGVPGEEHDVGDEGGGEEEGEERVGDVGGGAR